MTTTSSDLHTIMKIKRGIIKKEMYMNEQEKTNVQDRMILLLSNGNFEHTKTVKYHV